MSDFVHLHTHSNYSLLQGAFSIGELVGAAVRAGMPAVALTDTNGLYGAIEFYEAARAAGLKPIIGAEIVHGNEQCVLLAADRDGYANLCRIVTERRLADTPHYESFMAGTGREDDAFDVAASVTADPRGLFALTASAPLLERLHGTMPNGRLYAERRADGHHSFETGCPTLRGAVIRRRPDRRDIGEVAARLGIPFVATANVNFLTPEDRRVHAVLGAIRENVSLNALLQKNALLAGPRSFFRATPPAADGDAGAAANTRRIAEACNLELELGVPRFPRADLPPGESACRRLRAAVYAGARRRYGTLPEAIRSRIDYELDIIARLDFCDYFLVVHDICEFADRQGIPHVGRGSAGNSVVSYCLGITAVDPLKFDLYFERFLNEFRTDVPDIDIDFCWRRRDEIIDYVYRRYGAGRVAMVSTHSRLQSRSAFRDVARVMDLPMREIDSLSKRLPHYGASSIEEAMRTFPEMADFPIDKEPWRTVVRTALRIDGYVRHLGIHLGGLVIGDRPLTHYTALENSAKGIVVTQYEMGSIQRTGLVKMDLLGQRSLTIVAEAARAVEDNHGVRIDLDDLPDRTGRTAALLRHGRTMGCFQIESPGMRQLLQMLRARDIMGLIQALSLIRPGPSSSGMKGAFIERMRGREPVDYDTPLLEAALAGTYGVMLYQEDILRVAQSVAGFTLAEGDELRKAISKNRSRENLLRLADRFVRGAAERGVSRTVAARIWSQIESFAAYSYCKAHACTYGHISWQASWLKAHYPAEFLSAVIANKAGFYDARTYLADARRFNVPILAPSVNHSEIECRTEGGSIRPGLEFVRSLSRSTLQRILAHRAVRPFASLEDFHARTHPTTAELENLVLCGAFDELALTRPTLMMKAERLGAPGRVPGAPPARGVGSLFEADAVPVPTMPVPSQPPYSQRERVTWELRILGFSHSGHPLDAWNGQLARLGATPSFALRSRVGQDVTVAGWLVTARRATTKRHEYMKFLTLEDRHGVMEVVIFPDVYRRCGAHMSAAGCCRVRGRVKARNDAVSIVAAEISPLTD